MMLSRINTQFIPCLCLLFLLSCTSVFSLSVKKRESVETLRDAVSNAFDALTEVEHAIPKYDTDVFREETIDYEDSGMDKETAEKFVQEIDELEDILLNRDATSSNLKKHEKREKMAAKKKDSHLAEKKKKESDDTKSVHSKKDKVIEGMDFLVKKDKHYDLKNFFEENRDLLEEMETSSGDEEATSSKKLDEKKDEDTSLNVLLDVLKNGMDQKNEEEKFEEYLLSNFAKETQKKKEEAMKKETKKSTVESKKSDKKSTEQKKEATERNINEKKSSSDDGDKKDVKEVESCGDKSEKKECGGDKATMVDKKKTAEENENADKKEKEEKEHESTKTEAKKSESEETEKKRTTPKHITAHPKHKRPLWTKKGITDEHYDTEIKDLVDVILRRREDTKREKLKVALSDLFSILDTSKIHEE